MPDVNNSLEQVVGTDFGYHLVAFDEEHRERLDHPAGRVSEHVLATLRSEPITDVFLFSHGWQGDVASAREQYQGWLKAMADCTADRAKMREVRPGFRPLLVGLHWPSEPWGDESLAAAVSFALNAVPPTVDLLVERYAARLGDSPAVRKPLRVILEAARDQGEPSELPAEVASAYVALDAEVGLPTSGVTAAPGADRENFDPEAIYQAFLADEPPADFASFGLFSRDNLLAPLRVLSFWKMKDRARVFGESAVHPLLKTMQRIEPERRTRFHLAGHSFGCIVASAAIAGPPESRPLDRPVDSLVLLQGALSLWSYCDSIPRTSGKPGYFQRVVSHQLVRGPIVSTQSQFDTAVGTWYPRAAHVAQQVAFRPDEFPKYGAVGAWGAQALGAKLTGGQMLAAEEQYDFQPGRIYNLKADRYIKDGGGFSGAHSDIRKPEVAHAVWAAVAT